jgi:hypothetical protein
MPDPEFREIAIHGYQNENRCAAVWKADNNTLSGGEGQGLFDGFLIIFVVLTYCKMVRKCYVCLR